MEAGGFPALPEAPAGGEAALRRFVRGGYRPAAKSSAQVPARWTAFGWKPWPQLDADGGAAGLKPSPAILMRGTPPVTFLTPPLHPLQISRKSPMMTAL